MKQTKFLKRMMVILMGIILIIAAVIQIIQATGPLWLNVILIFLGIFEIALSVGMMLLEGKMTAKND